jgi:phosphoserine phosphatase RsbU/P
MAFARPLIRSAIDQARNPVTALDRTNSILVQERRSALFITALAGVLDLRTSVLRLANAGHEPPLVVPADGRPIRWLTGSGRLLGAFASLDLVPCEIQLSPGDLVLLYTDGVTDTRGDSGERFGDDRLLAVAEAARESSTREFVDAVVAATRAFQGSQPAADDVTIVAIRRQATGQRGGRAAPLDG